ncbi:hypothetical protein BJV74DRAFT_847413 [Russula compacta]|nr:hypothetical protein BJV74DRAFT_847413 [Russula compacta]
MQVGVARLSQVEAGGDRQTQANTGRGRQPRAETGKRRQRRGEPFCMGTATWTERDETSRLTRELSERGSGRRRRWGQQDQSRVHRRRGRGGSKESLFLMEGEIKR